MDRKLFWGIRVKEILVLLLFYFFFAFSYYFTLWLSQADFIKPGENFFDLGGFFDDGGLQYLLFLLTTIPIWWFIFVKIKSKPMPWRLLTHVITLPLFVYVNQQLYYYLADFFGHGHLGGSGQVWDVYIPGLLYFIQFGFFHAYEYYRENQRKLRIEGELRQAALKSELAALKAQLNPHFLYNVFNTINASVPAQNEKTRQMIAKLSDLFRYQLQASGQELVTLREELNFVKKYLDLEKERFEDRLKINIDVDKGLLDEKIPPMLLQPLVENSVKHGLSSLIEGGSISIRVFKEEERLKFEISDTGVGIQDKKSVFNKGIGLTNTRARLQKMYQSQLELSDNIPKGLKIQFAI